MLVSKSSGYSIASYLKEMGEGLSLRIKKAGVVCAAVALICFIVAILIQFSLDICLCGAGVLVVFFIAEYIIKFISALVWFVLLCRFIKFNKDLFPRNAVHDGYYLGIRPWNLTRSEVSSTTKTYDKDLFSAFNKYRPSDAILAQISLLTEHFCETAPTELLVRDGTILRDFRPKPSSLFFPLPGLGQHHELVCEAYRNDDDAHQGMLDCYRQIHAEKIVADSNFEILKLIPSCMVNLDYPSPKGNPGRKGLVRIYYEEPERNFPLLVPNYRLPQGPLFLPKEELQRNLRVCQGLEELLQLCLHLKTFCKIGWDNIFLDVFPIHLEGEEFLRVRTLSPKITKRHPGIGLAAEALSQWASVLGSQVQVDWLRKRIETLLVPQSVGSDEAEITVMPETLLGPQSVGSDEAEITVMSEPLLGPQSAGSTVMSENLSSDSLTLSNADIGREPQVRLTELEKEYILFCLDQREKALELFNKYAGQIPRSPILRSNYFTEKETRIESLCKNKKKQRELITQYTNVVQTKVRASTLQSCVQWLNDSFGIFATKNALSDSLRSCDRSVSMLGTRVLEPGIEPWFHSASQGEEMKAAFQILCEAGYIHSVIKAEKSGRLTILA